MTKRILVSLLFGTLTATSVVAWQAAPAVAHEERPASFPDGKGTRPVYKGLDNPNRRVVCRPDSDTRIQRMNPSPLKRTNQALLRACRYSSIQTAINSITKRGTSIYILPGVYTETHWANLPRSSYCSNLKTDSVDRVDAASYIGSITDPVTGQANAESDPIALSYYDQRRCPHNLNLIALFGDATPMDDSIKCNSKFCDTQLVGTGTRMTDVIIDNRFSKLNALRIDRGNGIYLKNFTVQRAEFNSVYVLETDGFVIDRLTTRANDEYGILAFASDHGLIQRTDNYFNGDSGIYPGSASDLNGDSTQFAAKRYAIEIRNNRSHHNTLGYSGTAGNSVYAHHNKFYANATGIATDSLFPGHPGLPQDHARWAYNEIFNNNQNYYTRFVDTGVCAKPMKERGYEKGTVCPVVPTPVGTGVLIAGGNYNSTDHNWIYDNHRYGTMVFWVPALLRDEYDPTKLYDTSHHNHHTDNKMGIAKSGAIRHNGVDHWWDEAGDGNCWEGNTYSRGHITDNFIQPAPKCSTGGSVGVPAGAVKDAGFLSCSQYDRNDPTWRHPPECNWFDDPAEPTAADPSPLQDVPLVGSQSGASTAPIADDWPLALSAGLVLLGGLALIRRSTRHQRS